MATHLKENLQNLHANHQLQNAGTGSQATIDPKKLLRSDVIHWLDRKHDNIYEHEFLNLIDLFVAHLNATCYTSIKSYEFHYTLYEKGSFYKKHIDQFRDNDSRQFSLIVYLNEAWQEADGGAERDALHQKRRKTGESLHQPLFCVRNGRLVLVRCRVASSVGALAWPRRVLAWVRRCKWSGARNVMHCIKKEEKQVKACINHFFV